VRLAALLLPALLLRALIPFGFMPVLAGGGLTIGFCPGEAAVPPGLTAAHPSAAQHFDHLGHHPGGHAGEPAGGAHHAPCLFAASANPAFAPALYAVASDTTLSVQPLAAPTTTLFLPTVLRAQSPRAPPQLS
jgi:hypothetical protein